MKRLLVVSVVACLVALSGTALAQETQEEKEDTIFNWAYDTVWRVLVWNLTANDGLYDCTLSGEFTTTYSPTEDGVDVDELTDESGVVSFPARPQDELAEGLVEADGPVEYTGADGECGLSGGSVEGPNGQINHGMFLSLFNSLYEGEGNGRGCVNRHLAQSDLGKGDQQVRVSEVDPDAPELAEGDTGTVEFETVVTDCLHGNQDNATEGDEVSLEDRVTGQEKAAEKRAEQAAAKAEREAARAEAKAEREQARADGERGNSGSAPGRNR